MNVDELIIGRLYVLTRDMYIRNVESGEEFTLHKGDKLRYTRFGYRAISGGKFFMTEDGKEILFYPDAVLAFGEIVG